jgi:hypothetical protein
MRSLRREHPALLHLQTHLARRHLSRATAEEGFLCQLEKQQQKRIVFN